ncbi:MAG: enoyl-CoA hydratase/isomerase family protein [Acidimicrobiales bacterium]
MSSPSKSAANPPEESELVDRSDTDVGITTLTLNRPDKLNALNPAMFVAFRKHIDAIGDDSSVGCVIVTGAGRSFCAGHDLGAISSGERAPSKHFEPETIDALEQLNVPTVAKIRGHCFTGGLEFALGCDLIFAAEDAQLGDTHGQWGLAPIWGISVRLPERTGLAAAKELMFTSRRISGVDAATIGLVDRAIPPQDLDDVVDTLAAEIVTNSWGTNRIDKQLLRDASTLSRREALEAERTRPYGMPDDMAERMRGGKRG